MTSNDCGAPCDERPEVARVRGGQLNWAAARDRNLDGEGVHGDKRAALVGWAARLGAVSAEALAHRSGSSLAAARGRLQAAVRAGMLTRSDLLAGRPALYSATRAGLRECGQIGLSPCRVTASNAGHLGACAIVAAALEQACPDHLVAGERELRRDEREHGAALASARLPGSSESGDLLHRPDLVLWPTPAAGVLPIAVEVEITLKGQRRLRRICCAWARCRLVAGVLYLVTDEVAGPLRRAVAGAEAEQWITVLQLGSLPGPISQAVPTVA